MTFHLALLGIATAFGGASAAERPLAIDPAHSVVEVEVRTILRNFNVQLTRYSARVVVEPGKGTVRAATFDFDWADLHSGNAGRNRELLRWAEHARFPAGHFILHDFESLPSGTGQARGELTLHGITHEVTFPVAVLCEGELYSLDGLAVVDFRDYGLPPVRRFRIRLVIPPVQVRFHLQGRLGAPEPGK